MRRRSFLKSTLAAYCTPIVMALAPMLMRPIEVEAEILHITFDYCHTVFRHTWPDDREGFCPCPNIRWGRKVEMVEIAHRPLNLVAVDD